MTSVVENSSVSGTMSDEISSPFMPSNKSRIKAILLEK